MPCLPPTVVVPRVPVQHERQGVRTNGRDTATTWLTNTTHAERGAYAMCTG
jgi:hypothetical protein